MRRPPGSQTFGYLPRSCSHAKYLRIHYLIEEANDLPRDVLPPGFLVVHDTRAGGQNDVAELTRRQQLDNPLLQVPELNVVTRGDDTSLVETAIELDDDLAAAVVIDFLKFANVA